MAYLVDDRLVVRFPANPDSAGGADVEREAAVLALAAELSPLPVPRVEFIEPGAGCLAYELLPGVPLLEVAEARRAPRAGAIAKELGRLLGALHAAPRKRVASLVEVDDLPMEEWLAEAARHYDAVGDPISPDHRQSVEGFLNSAPPAATGELVFSHNDLGIEHVLVDPESLEITGVIDWSDAALVDPARDFGLLLRDLGPIPLDPALRDRALFYARAALLEDLACGLEAGRPEYAEKSVAGLAWLFPA